jgi:hypothetical protein
MYLQITHSGTNPPSDNEIIQMWKELEIFPVDTSSLHEKKLVDAFKESHVNGGLKYQKFVIQANETFGWFASRNRLDEIYFTRKFLTHPQLEKYRDNVKVSGKLKVKSVKWSSDIFDVSGLLSRLHFHGGAYNEGANATVSWEISNNFIKQEFDNRFDTVSSYTYELEGADWFCQIMWDYSLMLFDKKTSYVYVFDITDTD